MSAAPTPTEPYPEHKEDFEVVMLKDGVSELDAKPEDIKRVHVNAVSSLAAQMHDDVQKFEGHKAVFVAKPGVPTDLETHARRRELEGAPVDYTKI